MPEIPAERSGLHGSPSERPVAYRTPTPAVRPGLTSFKKGVMRFDGYLKQNKKRESSLLCEEQMRGLRVGCICELGGFAYTRQDFRQTAVGVGPGGAGLKENSRFPVGALGR